MKICFSADWHISNFGPDKHGPITDRGAACLRVVERLYQLPAALHIGLGDIFDLDRPSPGLVRALQDRVVKRTALIVGNHDQTSTESTHHALAPLREQAHIVEDSEVFVIDRLQIGLVGFRKRDEVIDSLGDLEWQELGGPRILGVHLGVADDRTPAFLRNASDSIALNDLVTACQGYGITHVFAGNWHNPEDWLVDGVRVCQVGGLIPQRFGDPHDVHGRVALFDTKTGEVTFETLAGPRFVTVEGEPPWEKPTVVDADPLHLRFRISRDHADQARVLANAVDSVTTVRIDRTDVTPDTSVGEDGPASSGEELALTAAEKLGGSVLVDVMRDVFVRARGEGYVAAGVGRAGSTLRLKSIHRENYVIDGTHTLNLPRTGLVLITGDNGSGKSSWIDTAGVVWNTDTRDDAARSAQGNIAGSRAVAHVTTYDGLDVKRVWEPSGSTTLTWHADCHARGDTDESTTRAKGQKALNAVLGDYKLWRWACVLTSPADAFTTAKPAKRRSILENVLDLELLGKGFKVLHDTMTLEARRDLREQESAVTAAEIAARLVLEGLEGAQAARDGVGVLVLPPKPAAPEPPVKPREPVVPALVLPTPPVEPPEVSVPSIPAAPRAPACPELVLPPPPDPAVVSAAPEPPDRDTREKLSERISDYRQEREDLTAEVEELREEVARVRGIRTATAAELARAEEDASALGEDQCPTCRQDISPATAAAFATTVHDCQVKAAAAERAAGKIVGLARGRRDDCQARVRELGQLIDEHEREMRRQDAAWAHFTQTKESHGAYLLSVEQARSRAAADHAAAVAEAKRRHAQAVIAAQESHTAARKTHRSHVAGAAARYEADVLARAESIRRSQVAYVASCDRARATHTQAVATAKADYERAQVDYASRLRSLEDRAKEQARAYDEHCTRARAQHEAQAARLDEALAHAQARVAAAQRTFTEAKAAVDHITSKLRLYEMAESLIGASGAPRADSLNRAMRTVMADANEELERLESPMRVRLFAEGKDVGLEIVDENDRVKKYARLSNGEKRRVDVAVLRALGITAANVRGAKDDGTIWFDETLDGVDNAGIDAACSYVQTMARHRCVVVITHRPDVITRLRPKKHVVMEKPATKRVAEGR